MCYNFYPSVGSIKLFIIIIAAWFLQTLALDVRPLKEFIFPADGLSLLLQTSDNIVEMTLQRETLLKE